MNTTETFALDSADDLLNQYLDNVRNVRDKTQRIAANQRAVIDTLQRTAQALRRLAEANRR